MVRSLGFPRFAARLALAPLAALFAVSCGGSDVVDPADTGPDARLADVSAEARPADAPPEADQPDASELDDVSLDAPAAVADADARAADADAALADADARAADADARTADADAALADADARAADADARPADTGLLDTGADVLDAGLRDAALADADGGDASLLDARLEADVAAPDADAGLVDADAGLVDADARPADADATAEAEAGDGGLGLLGAARRFTVLAGSTITFTPPPPPTLITGDVGVSPGTSIDPFSPSQPVNGTVHAGDPVAQQGQSALTVAYNTLAGLPCGGGNNYTNVDLAGKTLPPGVYCFDTSAGLTGNLVLDAQSNPNAEWVFQIGSTLTTAMNSTVTVVGGGSACNVYWQVGSSATLGTGTAFMGNIVASASITLVTGATVLVGRTLAQVGAVNFDSNSVSAATCQ